jgi:hypothetical protein
VVQGGGLRLDRDPALLLHRQLVKNLCVAASQRKRGGGGEGKTEMKRGRRNRKNEKGWKIIPARPGPGRWCRWPRGGGLPRCSCRDLCAR